MNGFECPEDGYVITSGRQRYVMQATSVLIVRTMLRLAQVDSQVCLLLDPAGAPIDLSSRAYAREFQSFGILPLDGQNKPGNPVTDWINSHLAELAEAARSFRPVELFGVPMTREEFVALIRGDNFFREVTKAGYAIDQIRTQRRGVHRGPVRQQVASLN